MKNLLVQYCQLYEIKYKNIKDLNSTEELRNLNAS